MNWKWRRLKNGVWAAQHDELALWVEKTWKGGDNTVYWKASLQLADKWADNALFRIVCDDDGVLLAFDSVLEAQRAVEQVLPELLQDAYVAIRRKMRALDVEIPDDD